MMRKPEDRSLLAKPSRVRTLLLLGASVVLTCTGCMEGAEPDGAQVYYFSALERDTLTSTVIIDRGASISAEELAQLEPIFKSFDENAVQLFAQPDIEERLDSIEKAYFNAGRYLDLLVHYREDIERQGLAKSPGATRLLWGLVRLGQDAQSRLFCGELLRARPEDPDAWFLYGAYWIKYAAEDSEAARRVVLGWGNTIRFDPRYRGFEGVDAGTLAREVSRLRLETGVTQAELDALSEGIFTTPTGANAAPSPDGSSADPATAVIRQAEVIARAKSGEVLPVEPEAIAKEEPGTAPQNEPEPGVVTQDVVPIDEPATQALSAAQQFLLELAQANMKLVQGDSEGALVALQRALLVHIPEAKVDRADEVLRRDVDLFTLVRLSWKLEYDRNGAARLFRKIAAHPTSETMVIYKYAMFALKELEDRPFGRTLLLQVKKQDADFAARYKVDELLVEP